LTDLDAKATELAKAIAAFDAATELIKRGHKLLAECGENNCKTKQWLKAGVAVSSTLAETAQRALTATKRAADIQITRRNG